METARTFIAVDIGEVIRGKLDELQHRLRKVHSEVRWVNPHNIHLTLAFLGDVPKERLALIRAVLDRSCGRMAAFDLQALGTGTFGKPKYPRVVWAGIADCPPLMKLQKDIVQALLAAGIGFDCKPFSPHLTLGRIKDIDKHTQPLLEKLEKYRVVNLGKIHVEAVELLQSTLSPHGAEYTVLHKVRLMEDSASAGPGDGGASPSTK